LAICQIRGDTSDGLTLLPFLLENSTSFVINWHESSAALLEINVV
jgi:hypothetical protein